MPPEASITNYSLAELRGKPITEFLSAFCRIHPEVARLRFAAYVPEPKLSERLSNVLAAEEENLRDEAVAICRGNGIPFWDALLGLCMKRNAIPERFLESASVHNSRSSQDEFDVARDDVSSERISELVKQLPEGQGLVVSSKLYLESGDAAQIPMLDFRCPCSIGNAHAIRKILTLLDHKSGVLVESGHSYHYYGGRLLSVQEWIEFMAHALLFAPIVDPRYVAHRIADGECRLKIAASKDSIYPIIVDIYENGD